LTINFQRELYHPLSVNKSDLTKLLFMVYVHAELFIIQV